MPLQSSGEITFAQIQTEFGGSNPIGIDEYYSGGANVPSSVTAVPTSGEIEIADFYGTSNVQNIPFTNYAQNNGTNNAAFVRDSATSGIVINHAAYLEVRMRRTDPYVYLEVRERYSGYDFARWYNTSNTATTLSTTYVPLARFNLTGITAIKMNWTGPSGSGFGNCYLAGETNGPSATYNAVDDTFRTVSNNQSIAFAFAARSSAECYASNVRNCSTVVTATARKTGYADTTVGSYLLASRSTATSNNCF